MSHSTLDTTKQRALHDQVFNEAGSLYTAPVHQMMIQIKHGSNEWNMSVTLVTLVLLNDQQENRCWLPQGYRSAPIAVDLWAYTHKT